MPQKSRLQSIALSKVHQVLNGGPIVLVSTTDGRTPDAAPISWTMPLDFKPALFAAVIAGDHKTASNLRKTRECVVQIPTAKQAGLVMQLGSQTGHKAAKLNKVPRFAARQVAAPCLSGCAVWIEARVRGFIRKHEIVIFEAVRAYGVPGALDRNGRPDVRRFPRLHHIGGDVFGICSKTVKSVR